MVAAVVEEAAVDVVVAAAVEVATEIATVETAADTTAVAVVAVDETDTKLTLISNTK